MADNNYEIDVTLEETFGTGVRSVEQTATSAESGGMNEITVTLTNDQENKFYIMNGLAGKDGRDGGFPVAVGEASLMTDTSKIYLYVGIEEGYTQNHLYYWDGEAWHDYGTYGAPADYLRSASVTHEQGLDQLGNTTYTADTLTIEGNADGVPAETEFVQKLYYSAGENVDGALTQKATSEAIESAQYLPIVNHPNAPVGDTALSVELQQNVMNVIGGVGYAFTTITMTLATKKAGKINRYFGRFTTGGNAIAVTWPTGVTVPSALSYKTQTTYDFVIEDSILHVWEDGNAVGDVLDATATANAVSTWLTNHPEATTTVADGSITTAKLASGVIDQTLTVQGAAADSAKVGQELSDLKSQITTKTGWTDDQKQNLLALLRNILYTSDVKEYYDAFEASLYPPANLSYISAVYTQSGTVVDTDSIDSLKSDLVVTAHYDNGTSEEITNYTLSGALSEGTSEITVSYGGKTTTFNVTVSSSVNVVSYELGGIATADGAETEATNRLRSDFIHLSNGERIVLTNGSNQMAVRIYDTSKTYTGSNSGGWITTYTATAECFVRIVIRKVSDADFTENEIDGDTLLTTSTYYVFGRNVYPTQNLYIYNGKGVSGTEISDNANRALTEAISDISWLTSPMYTARYTDDTDGRYIFKFVDSNGDVITDFETLMSPAPRPYPSFGIINNYPVKLVTERGGTTANTVPSDAVKLRLLFANSNTSSPFSTVPTGIVVINNHRFKLVEGNADDFV